MEVFKILKLLQNKKGMSYVGLLVSLVIFLAIVAIAGNFKVYVTQHKVDVIKHNEVSQAINNHIANIYNNNDWETLEGQIITTDYGEILVEYEPVEITEFSTKKLNLTFEFNGELQTYELERSVYHE